MTRLLQFWRRSRSMIRRDIDAELQFHIDSRTEALVREGLTRDEARVLDVPEFLHGPSARFIARESFTHERLGTGVDVELQLGVDVPSDHRP